MTDLPDTSPNLGLPFYLTKQNEFEVQHNEALLVLDALVMLSALDRDLTSPPAEPALGDRYIVKAPGSGGFAGKDNRIAQYDVGGWNFYAPQEGWTCYVCDESALLAWDGESWQPAIDVLGGATELQNLTRLGVGTEADATNPFAAKLNNALWTARTEAEGGNGDLRYKLSKESASKTLSMLFQTAYEGRAEIGLTGDDDFHFKVSADGEIWLDAIVIDRATGEVTMPQTAPAGAPADIDLALAQLALGLADALNCAQFLGPSGNRFADSFDALTYVDTAGATNLDSATAGLLKPSGSGTSYANAGGQGDRTASISIAQNGLSFGGGTLDNLIDGGTGASNSDAFYFASGFAASGCWIKFDFGAGASKVIDEAKWRQNTANTHGTWKWQGSDNNTDWTDIGSGFSLGGVDGEQTQSQLGGNTTGYRYYRLLGVSGNVSGSPYVQEITFRIADAPVGASDMTVASTALTAAAAPAAMKVVAQTKHVDTITLGTDLMFDVSRDGGTTWTEADMNDRFAVNGIHVLESDEVDVSAQPSGTQVKWRARTGNGKAVELHGIAVYWS